MAAQSAPDHRTKRSTYVTVFVVLAVVTAVEVGLSTMGLATQLSNGLFLLLSFIKAALVAGFFMHLRSDSRLYRYIFLLPLVLLIIFTTLTILS